MSCEDIPSLLDLQNTKKHVDDLGRLMGTGTGTSTNEVTGQVRPTYNAVMANLGYTRVGTFAIGATLLNGRQTLLWDIADGGDGQEYGWSGNFPKTVPAGGNPNNTGGIAVGAWMSRADPVTSARLRELTRRICAEAGLNLVDGSFEAGGTLASESDVLIKEGTGVVYSWDGAYPKTVQPNSSTGGFSIAAHLLRDDLLSHVASLSAHTSQQIAHGQTNVRSALNSNSSEISALNVTTNQHKAEINTLKTAQNGGVYGFDTKASMLASVAPDGAVAYVMNDPTPSENGTYRKTGSAWVKSSGDMASAAFDSAKLANKLIAPLAINDGRFESKIIKTFDSFINPDAEFYGRTGYYEGTGINPNPAYKTTGLYPVVPGQKFVLLNSNAQAAYFDSNKVQLWSVSFANGVVHTVPDNHMGRGIPAYVSFSSTAANVANRRICAGFGELVPSVIVPFGELLSNIGSESLADNIFDIARREKIKALDMSGSLIKTFDSFINPDAEFYGRTGYYDGTGINTNAAYKTTGLYPVVPGQKFVLINSNAKSAYFDSNKVQLWDISLANGVVHTVPDNHIGRGIPAYVSFSSTAANVDGRLICAGFGELAPPTVVPFGSSYSNFVDAGILTQIGTNLSTLRIATFGDSITAGTDNWPAIFAKYSGASYVNFAVNGGHWEDFTGAIGNQWLSKQVDAFLAQAPSVDCVIIAMGTNSLNADYGDFATAVSGNLATVDRTKVFGGMRHAIERLQNYNQSLKIMMVVPLQSQYNSSESPKFVEMRNAIIRMGAYMSVPVIDAGMECGITYHVESKSRVHLYDGLHTAPSGKELQGRYILAKFKSLYTHTS